MANAFGRWKVGAPLTAKLLLISVMVLSFLIPLASLTSLVRERQARSEEARSAIIDTWGDKQHILGPFIVVPYLSGATSPGSWGAEGERAVVFSPEQLNIGVSLDAERRSRSLFSAVVYKAGVRLSGHFLSDSATIPAGIPEAALEWRNARLVVGISDQRGIEGGVSVQLDGSTRSVRPGVVFPGFEGAGFSAPVDLSRWRGSPAKTEGGKNPEGDGPADASAPTATPPLMEMLPFEVLLALRGSEEFGFHPDGDETTVEVVSNWPSPGFSGAFLPSGYEMGEAGFRANWSTSRLALGYPSSWSNWSAVGGRVHGTVVRVKLVEPVDRYLSVERSVKYGLMFVSLTFLAFFLFEIISGLRVHFVPYGLIGGALVLFYLALLALSEHLPFSVAYGVAAAAVVAMVGLYSRAVLAAGRPALAVASVIAALYSVLFVLLTLEVYALLSGTVLLFAALGATMYLTRNIDWHGGQIS